MTIGERIKEVRKSNNLTQTDFGKQVKISGASVSMIEKGINNPSDQTITLICSKFNVSEQWLRTGEGEMSAKSYEDALEAMCAERGLSHADYVAIRNLMEMPTEARDAVTAYMLKFAQDILSEQTAAPPPKSREQIAEEEAEAIKQRILEANLAKGKTMPVSGTPRSGSGIA